MIQTTTLLFVLILCCFATIGPTNAFEGDFADESFQCPAITTCPVACVASLNDCPPDHACPVGETLCNDGTCAPSGSTCSDDTDDDDDSPCPYDCAPFACARPTTGYDQCKVIFQDIYDTMAVCEEQALKQDVPWVSPTNGWFVFLYSWISITTLAVLAWCAWNQRVQRSNVSPSVPLMAEEASSSSARHIIMDETSDDDDDDNNKSPSNYDKAKHADAGWIQTPYRTSFVGSILYCITVLTLVGIHVVLGILTILYYMQQGVILQEFDPPPIQSDRQVLLVFAIVWSVGFVWAKPFLWPSSVSSLFLRRCTFAQATHVAVFSPMVLTEQLDKTEQQSSYIGNMIRKQLKHGMSWILTSFRKSMIWLFSDVSSRGGGSSSSIPGETTFLRVQMDPTDGTRSFVYRLRRYNYEASTTTTSAVDADGCFVPGVWNTNTASTAISVNDYLCHVDGLWSADVQLRKSVVGPNEIVLQKPSLIRCIYQEFNKPFYLYQTFIYWTWFPLWYVHMAILYTMVRWISGIIVSILHYQNEVNLYRFTTNNNHENSPTTRQVEVLRDGTFRTIPQRDVVPGDVITVQVMDDGTTTASTTTYDVDMVLVEADHVLVDESALTGEVTPVAKTQLDAADGDAMYNPQQEERHNNSTIYAGTIILETTSSKSKRDLAIVTNTGSFTAKGRLVRNILSQPKRHRFLFDVEIEIVICFLLTWGIIASTAVWIMLWDLDPIYGCFHSMWVLGSSLPPLLPTVFVVSVGISARRLNKKRITTCGTEQMILSAGKVKVAFLDKTGTLTKQGLDFFSSKSFGSYANDLRQAMMVCHGLTKSRKQRTTITTTISGMGKDDDDDDSHNDVDGTLVGNTVDKIMFQATEATLHVGGEGRTTVSSSSSSSSSRRPSIAVTDPTTNQQFTILKRFEFDHTTMTQSVIVRDDSEGGVGSIFIFVKGSPERIKSIATEASVPEEYDDIVARSGRKGLYQIAMAKRMLPTTSSGDKDDSTSWENLSRSDVERDVFFLGFVNFKNTLREETPHVLAELHRGDIRTIMVTGDSILTGIHMAYESGLVYEETRILIANRITPNNDVEWLDWDTEQIVTLDMLREVDPENLELAVTGEVWLKMVKNRPELAREFAPKIRVFGRCTPAAKVSIIDTFNKDGHVTLMCGDGGNDCGALKTAHVGIAMSEAEASMVAPFTSTDKSLTAVVDVLKEGRCALASAFASYKFMLMVGLIGNFIQFSAAYLHLTLSPLTWALHDGGWVLSLAFSLPLAKAAGRLSRFRPTSSLLGSHTMYSFLGVLIINITFVIGAFFVLFGQSWFQCRQWENTFMGTAWGLGDNYESTILFLVPGYQLVITAAAYNFGFSHRAAWGTNTLFVYFFVLWTVLQLYIILVPSKLSCLFSVNCVEENTVLGMEIANVYNTTLLPVGFRWKLVGLLMANLIVVCGWEYFVVNYGSATRRSNKQRKRRSKQSPSSSSFDGWHDKDEQHRPLKTTSSHQQLIGPRKKHDESTTGQIV